ncbi:MAG: aminodeoxychorismate/anthranilate synthase component II [Acidobacteria bacterium]|nr:aminodeoxychorismate/anthranilate synthase component II [Acidobacteriota bacterium]
MILVIDNYDSFTYNLVQYLGELGREIPVAAEIKVIRNDRITIEEIEELQPGRILLSPGPCTPDDAGITLDVIRHFAGKIPLLGVCLGHQAIGQAFGGSVVRAPYLMHGKTSQVLHDSKTIFEGVENPFIATRYHSLIVERNSVPPVLEISATTSDGLVMGLRHREFICEGVQFHPESIMTGEGRKLLRNFLNLV